MAGHSWYLKPACKETVSGFRKSPDRKRAHTRLHLLFMNHMICSHRISVQIPGGYPGIAQDISASAKPPEYH
jgi:hypothetical protein